jgi:2-hydroxychromene-2-carboxylate isomerase
MKTITFWFDPISPYAYLAFEHLPQALQGFSVVVDYRPVLFAGLLQHWGHKGPAEIEPKRAWTFRQVAWAAHEAGITLHTPEQHPFNPLALLRLAQACAPAGGTPNRRVVEMVLHHVWRGHGADASDADRMTELTQRLAPARDPNSTEVKAELRTQTDAALARGLFGVPTIEVDDKLFWGLDSLPMLVSYLRGDAFFAQGQWEAAGQPRPGIARG